MKKEDKGTGSFVKECPGVAGFRLVIASDDEGMFVTVVTPDEREHPLDYAEVIAPGPRAWAPWLSGASSTGTARRRRSL